MLDFLVDDFLVAVEREVIALGRDVGLWNAEALGGSGALALGGVARRPAGQYVGQVVLRVLFSRETSRQRTELVFGQQRRSLVV